MSKAERRVIDLRSQQEREQDPLPEAEAWTLEQLVSRRRELELADELYVVCSDQDQCRQAADLLAGLGFKNARNYRRGLHVWKGEYLPPDSLERQEQPILRGYTEDDPENLLPRR